MLKDDLARAYEAYIACLNDRAFDQLGDHVAENVRRNGEQLGLAGYRRLLENDVASIPDLKFNVDFLVCDPPVIGARLIFDCTPKGLLFGLPVNGRRVRFTENVFYAYAGGKIENVWSVIDEAAVRAQIG